MSSPPHPSSFASASRKRPSLTPLSGPPSIKRRKPSSTANSVVSNASRQHPLRQTSFPPNEQQAVANSISPRGSSFSPPYAGSFRGSSVAGSSVADGPSGRGKGSGRGRKRKSQAPDARSGVGSSVAGTNKGAAADGRGTKSATGKRAEEEEDDDEDDDADAADNAVFEAGGKLDEAAAKQEREHLDMLIAAFSQDQYARYETWRRVKLKEAIVRRITNQTLSQSVPASIVKTINGYTKLFIGEIIERARDVQTEWLAADPLLPTGEAKSAAQGQLRRTVSSSVGIKTEPSDSQATEPFSSTQGSSVATLPERYRVDERDRGPLTPDHLREALRRYKKDREGGGAGFHGLSMQGKENVAIRTGGKRLFR